MGESQRDKELSERALNKQNWKKMKQQSSTGLVGLYAKA